jgi:hypothetical protein
MTIALVVLETALFAALAWAGVKLYKGRHSSKPVPRPQRAAGIALLSVSMPASFVVPYAAGQPLAFWWIPPCVVAGVILDGTRRRRHIRKGPVWFAGWMLLTAGAIELVFWAGEQLLASG